MNNGYVKLHRKVKNNIFWKRPYNEFQAWTELILDARFSDGWTEFNGVPVYLKRGQFVTTLKILSEKWGWDKRHVQSFLEICIKEKMISLETVRGRSGYSVVTILNYSKFQASEIDGTFNGTLNGTFNNMENKEVTDTDGTFNGTLNGTLKNQVPYNMNSIYITYKKVINKKDIKKSSSSYTILTLIEGEQIIFVGFGDDDDIVLNFPLIENLIKLEIDKKMIFRLLQTNSILSLIWTFFFVEKRMQEVNLRNPAGFFISKIDEIDEQRPNIFKVELFSDKEIHALTVQDSFYKGKQNE